MKKEQIPRKKITKEEIKMLKSNIDKMVESEEQFIFILFKNKKGKDSITSYSYNTIPEKLAYFLGKKLKEAGF